MKRLVLHIFLLLNYFNLSYSSQTIYCTGHDACKNKIWNFNRKILKELQKANKKLEKSYETGNSELRKEANLRIREIKKIRKRLRREYFKKIPKPKDSDKIWDYLRGGETEFRIWNDSEEKLLEWVELLLSFEKEKFYKQ